MAIPWAPFMRIVKEMAQRTSNVYRSQTPIISCLQEALEDFLIDFLVDSYICVAHARRITLMDKDVVVVSRVRYRFDKIVQPLHMTNKKAYDLLRVPPVLRKKKDNVVKIEEIVEEKPLASPMKGKGRREPWKLRR